MIWNILKQIFWCGIFHETTPVRDLAYPDVPLTEDDIGQTVACIHCGTTYLVGE